AALAPKNIGDRPAVGAAILDCRTNPARRRRSRRLLGRLAGCDEAVSAIGSGPAQMRGRERRRPATSAKSAHGVRVNACRAFVFLKFPAFVHASTWAFQNAKPRRCPCEAVKLQ